MTRSRLLVLGLIVAALAVFFASGAQRYFTFENAKQQQAAIEAYYQSHVWQTVLVYFALYIALTGLSVVGAATAMTLLGGSGGEHRLPTGAHALAHLLERPRDQA